MLVLNKIILTFAVLTLFSLSFAQEKKGKLFYTNTIVDETVVVLPNKERRTLPRSTPLLVYPHAKPSQGLIPVYFTDSNGERSAVWVPENSISQLLEANEEIARLLTAPTLTCALPQTNARNNRTNNTENNNRHANTAVAYENCNNEFQDYMGQEIKTALQLPENAKFAGVLEELSTNENAGVIGQCIAASQKKGQIKGWKYAQCTNGQMETKSKRTCASADYSGFVTANYLRMTECLGISPRELFPLLNRESRFHSNVGSFSGVWGIGQTTGPTIQEAEGRLRKNNLIGSAGSKTSFDKISGSKCEPVKNALQSRKDLDVSPCGRIKVPENPMRNLVYSGLNYLSNRKAAEEVLNEWVTNSGSRIEPAMREDFQKMIQELTFFMYNGGLTGIKDVFELFTVDHSFPMSFTNFRNTFSKYLGNCYGGQSSGVACDSNAPPKTPRKTEVSTYTINIQQNLSAIEKAAGDIKCSL